jgi:hypothetical protein
MTVLQPADGSHALSSPTQCTCKSRPHIHTRPPHVPSDSTGHQGHTHGINKGASSYRKGHTGTHYHKHFIPYREILKSHIVTIHRYTYPVQVQLTNIHNTCRTHHKCAHSIHTPFAQRGFKMPRLPKPSTHTPETCRKAPHLCAWTCAHADTWAHVCSCSWELG